MGPQPISLMSKYEEIWIHKETQGCTHTEKGHVRAQQEGGHLQDKKKRLKAMILANTLILDFSASRILKK